MTTQTDVQDVLDRLKTAQQSRSVIPALKALLGLKRARSRKTRALLLGSHSTIWSLAPNFCIRC